MKCLNCETELDDKIKEETIFCLICQWKNNIDGDGNLLNTTHKMITIDTISVNDV